MNFPRKSTFTWSQKFFGFIFIFHIIGNTPAFASPIPSLSLMDPQFMESMVADCCKVRITDRHHRHEKRVLEGYSEPGIGEMVQLDHSPFYRQKIIRKICVAKNHPSHHQCSQFAGSNICQSGYAKQKAIVKDGGIGEIWVENGCKYGRLWIKLRNIPKLHLIVDSMAFDIHSVSFLYVIMS